MALPKLNAPSYEMKIPSTGETVKFRPFLVKEQKMLMIAQESKDPNMMGGLSVKIGDETLDLSIRGKVKKLINQLNF